MGETFLSWAGSCLGHSVSLCLEQLSAQLCLTFPTSSDPRFLRSIFLCPTLPSSLPANTDTRCFAWSQSRDLFYSLDPPPLQSAGSLRAGFASISGTSHRLGPGPGWALNK